MKKTLAAAAIIALGIGTASVTPNAFAYNQQDRGTTGYHGSGEVGHYPGNQGSGNNNGNGNAANGPNSGPQ